MPNIAILFLKEPGKSLTLSIGSIYSSARTLKLLVPGTELKIRAKTYALLFNNETVAQIDREDIRQKIKYGLEKGINIRCYVVKANKSGLKVLIRCDRNIFSSKNYLEIRPSTKHEGVLEEGLAEESNPIEGGEENLADEENILIS